MTKSRLVYLQNNYVLADSGEYVFNVGTQDVITRLDLQLAATNGATNNKAVTIADVLTSVDFMNGSEPIVSLSGYELYGLSVNREGRWVDAVISEAPNAVQSMMASIDFGRWYGDEQMALDLSKFPQFQIRVKWNLAAIRAVGATGFVSGSGRLTVIAHILEGGQNPMGYLSLKRHAAITTSASGVAQFYLPTDKTIRAVGIRSYKAGTGQLSGVSNVRLVMNENAARPLDMTVTDFLESVNSLNPPYFYRHVFHGQANNTLYTLLKYKEAVQLNSQNKLANASYVSTGIGEGALQLVTGTTGADLLTDTLIDGTIIGYLPFSTAYMQFGTYDDPNTWLAAPNYKSIRLELDQNVAGANLSVTLEQLNTY